MKYTPQQREDLLRLFDARTGSIREFATQHHEALSLRPHGFLGNKTPNMAEAEHFTEHPTNLD